ncbi:hypothetical protein BGZ60DRAFT_436578 [Tricladium varicosporioides]|nr:hypothetical protein BGZ60DRAFT_436578 [Hymenoscyphus varicosporioides]
MFSNDRKPYGLRSKTNSRTQYEPARPHNPSYTSPEISRLYASPTDPTPFTSIGYLSASSKPSASSTHSSSSVTGVNPAPYTGPRYSRRLQSLPPAKSVPYFDSGYLNQSSGPVPTLQYTRLRSSAQNNSPGKTVDQDVADLVGQLSETHIDEQPSAQHYQSTPILTPHQDAIDEVVQEVLTRDLKTLGDEKLLPTNSVFDLARDFAERWGISDEAVDSHIKLACGYFKFPVILLLNPAPKHESLAFDDMVKGCKTLRWIKDVLHTVGLKLGDVIILDACTLLGNHRIKDLGEEKEQAMAEAYTVTQEMLKLIQPNIILSCQCSTSFPSWNAGGHIIARQLCSSIRSARNHEVKKVYLNNHTINVIQAYHPSGFLNNQGDRKAHHDTSGNLLKDVYRTVYTPCANWKSQHLLATLASSYKPNYIGVSVKKPVGTETKTYHKSVLEMKFIKSS